MPLNPTSKKETPTSRTHFLRKAPPGHKGTGAAIHCPYRYAGKEAQQQKGTHLMSHTSICALFVVVCTTERPRGDKQTDLIAICSVCLTHRGRLRKQLLVMKTTSLTFLNSSDRTHIYAETSSTLLEKKSFTSETLGPSLGPGCMLAPVFT